MDLDLQGHAIARLGLETDREVGLNMGHEMQIISSLPPPYRFILAQESGHFLVEDGH
jgi:hypothetical protein